MYTIERVDTVVGVGVESAQLLARRSSPPVLLGVYTI